jgi:hypothetical protein
MGLGLGRLSTWVCAAWDGPCWAWPVLCRSRRIVLFSTFGVNCVCVPWIETDRTVRNRQLIDSPNAIRELGRLGGFKTSSNGA